ncbi:MAG TPA: hypothetical protein PKN95_13390 [Verrucomicrobiota bacterium]|nr:hypothetical protein [Verrucomicrobiota bacterium]HNT15643.1 hypothetical protein [Verrucomicrobiota bacterium]
METQDDHPPLEPRLANTDGLTSLCRFRDETRAKYIIIGRFARMQSGFAHATRDRDLLIDPPPGNFAEVTAAMPKLPDDAVREVTRKLLTHALYLPTRDFFGAPNKLTARKTRSTAPSSQNC